MYAILRFFYAELPAYSPDLTAEVFENEYLAKTGKLGQLYFDWLCSFDEDFTAPGMGAVYRREKRRQFVAEAVSMDCKMSDLLYMLSLELDAAGR